VRECFRDISWLYIVIGDYVPNFFDQKRSQVPKLVDNLHIASKSPFKFANCVMIDVHDWGGGLAVQTCRLTSNDLGNLVINMMQHSTGVQGSYQTVESCDFGFRCLIKCIKW
jgi:hypothetical protein